MKKAFSLIIVLVIAITAMADKGGGGSISFGYLFSDAVAAKEAYIALVPGEELNSTNELVLDIRGWGIVNRFIRVGGTLSGGYFDAKGNPSQTTLEEDEAGVGFGDVRVGVMPEIYTKFGQFDFSGGLALGGGSIITFVNDDNGDNDGNMSYYFFMRPQFSTAYGFGSVGFELATGYHLPLGGQEGEFWFLNDDSDTVRHAFEPSEIGGFFVQLGIFFGKKGIK